MTQVKVLLYIQSLYLLAFFLEINYSNSYSVKFILKWRIFRKEEYQKENQKLKKKLKEREEELIALEEANTLLKDEHFALLACILIFLLDVKI